MRKQVGVVIAVAVLMLGNSGPVLAAVGSVRDWAVSDAEQAVISRQTVNEAALRQRGREYTTAFLAGYAQASNSYQRAYYQGLRDGQGGHSAVTLADRVSRVAYQRGYERGHQQFSSQAPESATGEPQIGSASQSEPATTTEPGQAADQQTYSTQQLSPNQAKFIQRIAKNAQRVGLEYDLYPSVIIAQAALESNWGVSGLASQPYHNLFGVKGAFHGHAIRQPTTEYTKEGKQLEISDYFRWYDNDYQSLCDYAETLNDPLYEGVHRSQASNYRQATHFLLGRYATDPQYDRKLNRLIDSYHLTRYDHQPTDGGRTNKGSVMTPPVADPTVHEKQAIVKQHPHRIGWLSVIGGVSSAGALGLLRRFIS